MANAARIARAAGARLPESIIRRGEVRVGAMHGTTEPWESCKEASTMADAGPPLVLIALGLVLWLAVNATLAGISIQTIGVILFVVGIVWLVIELIQAHGRRGVVVRDEPVVHERRRY
jgi:hypothetical protein